MIHDNVSMLIPVRSGLDPGSTGCEALLGIEASSDKPRTARSVAHPRMVLAVAGIVKRKA
jgi:hypothetical protein